MSSTAQTTASTVVHQRFADPPSSSRRVVSRTSGISANGMPNDSTTWLSTSASVGSTPSSRMMSAGISVTSRRASSGMCTCSSPCMISAPA